MRTLLLNKVLRSSWTIAAASITVASLLEWGLIAQGGPDTLQSAADELGNR